MFNNLRLIYRGALKILLPAAITAAVLLLHLFGVFGPIQHTLNDAQFRWRPRREASNRIVIIGVDAESEKKLGTSFIHWPRAWTGQVITSLADAGAEIIALDFRYPMRPGREEDDQALAGAIADSESVVLAAMVEGGQLLRSDEKIREGCIVEGFLNVKEDEDGVLRRIRFAKISEEELPNAQEPVPLMLYFDLAIVAALKYVEDIEDIRIEGDRLTLVERDEEGAEIGEHTVTIGNHLINYVGPSGSFARIPFWKILRNEFDPQEVRGKVCLVGDVRLRGGDFFVTPHSQYYRPTPESDPILDLVPGIEVHANGIQTVLENKTIRESTTGEAALLIIVLGLGLGSIFFFLKRGGLVLPALIAAAALGLTMLLGYYLFAAYGYQLASIPCLFTVALQFTGGVSYRWIAARRRVRQIQEMFGKYVSANVVKKMISGELSVNLEGHAKEISVLFSDIRNFTKTSEKLSAEQIGKLLNAFFSRMISVVFSLDGTLDKLMGDCIMVFFNDPEEQPDHPGRSASVALGMIRELASFKEEMEMPGVQYMDIGIGINTGTATVGNLGAPQFYDYTAIGDTVNLASRLEGANKLYGTHIIINEATCERIRDEFCCRELDLVRVKGKDEPVRIYELMAEKERATEVQKRLKAGYERALALYRDRQFEEARSVFASILKEIPDKPSQVYLERCREHMERPPDKDWCGVFVFTTK